MAGTRILAQVVDAPGAGDVGRLRRVCLTMLIGSIVGLSRCTSLPIR